MQSGLIMLYVQPFLLKEITKDENHPAVQESYTAIWNLVERIHKYIRRDIFLL